MEHRFVVEAKTFLFSAKVSKFRLEERRKGFVGVIIVGKQCASWLAATVEEAIQSPVKVDFVRDFREEGKSILVSRGDNKAGRFLEVAASTEGGRKGIIWIPEARSGRGWRRFVVELRSLLASVECSVGFSPPKSSSSEGSEETGSRALPTPAWVDNAEGCFKERSFLEVLQSKPSAEMKGRSSLCMDILQVASKVAVGIGGDDSRRALDCHDFEFSGVAAGPAKKDPVLVKRRVEKRVGYFHKELGRVIAGLVEGMLGGLEGSLCRKRALAVLKWLGLGPSSLLKSAGRFQGLCRPHSKLRLAFKPFGPGRLKLSDMASFSSATGVEPLSARMSDARLGVSHSVVLPSASVCVCGSSDEGSAKPSSVDSPAMEATHAKDARLGYAAGDVFDADDGYAGEALVPVHGFPSTYVEDLPASSLSRDWEVDEPASSTLSPAEVPVPPVSSPQVVAYVPSSKGSVGTPVRVPEDSVTGVVLVRDTVGTPPLVSDAVLEPLDAGDLGENLGPAGEGSSEPSGSVDFSDGSVSAPESQPLVNGLTEAQAWFFGWMRQGGFSVGV
jgi:hypothetical protein